MTKENSKNIENPFNSRNIETCFFCQKFHVCPQIYKFRKALKFELEFWGEDLPFRSLREHLFFGVHKDVDEALNKIRSCLRSKLYLYFRKQWKTILLPYLPLEEYCKRRYHLQSP